MPFEVMGLMLGDFVDEYTVKVVDVFAMPQRGTSMTVEAVDPVFQQQMMEMLRQTGRPEAVVGWYHSHPGWGCWLSGVDVNTQQSFEQLNARSVAVVVDPVISVKGKVVIDAFRCIPRQMAMMGITPRQTTSLLGHLKKPTIQALMHGLNRHYYSMVISFRMNALETKMLKNLNKCVQRCALARPTPHRACATPPCHRKNWKAGLHLAPFEDIAKKNAQTTERMVGLVEAYAKQIEVREMLGAIALACTCSPPSPVSLLGRRMRLARAPSSWLWRGLARQTARSS